MSDDAPLAPLLHSLQHTTLSLPRVGGPQVDFADSASGSGSGRTDAVAATYSVLHYTPPAGSHTATVVLLHGLGGTGAGGNATPPLTHNRLCWEGLAQIGLTRP